MSEEPDGVDLATLGLTYAVVATEDLKALIGIDLRLKGPTVDDMSRDDVLGDEPVAHTLCFARDGSDDTFHIVVPRVEAATLASLLMGQGEERTEEMRTESMDEETLDAFGEIMNLTCGVMSRVFNEEFGLPTIGIKEATTEVESPHLDEQWLPASEFKVARYRLIIPGYPDGRLDLLFPRDVADKWFGDGGASKKLEPAPDEPTSIVIIDACDDDRKLVEDMEDDLGLSVWALDPDEFSSDDFDEFAETGAFFIAWDLGVRPGLAILEALQHDDRTRRIPIVMVSDKPTEAIVRAALSAGATSFARKPYLLEEVQTRLQEVISLRTY